MYKDSQELLIAMPCLIINYIMVVDVHVHYVHCKVLERITVNSPIATIALMKIAYHFIIMGGSWFYHGRKNYL